MHKCKQITKEFFEINKNIILKKKKDYNNHEYTKIQKNNYSIADTLPLTSSKRPIYSKPAGFHIPPSRCSGNFKPGDKITIIYARSRELNIYDRLHLAAICAFPCPTEPNDNHKKAS